ncbi:hypothetical protein [Mesorhizobium sp. WSM2239]|uniref:Uncharacterized protein n=2 Tax=unclassified Mesorhizobium TaxID=325217 RepID=A0AAU8D9Y8_9HYPH
MAGLNPQEEKLKSTYQAVGSRRSRVSRVLQMLEELEAPYEFVHIERRSPEPRERPQASGRPF